MWETGLREARARARRFGERWVRGEAGAGDFLRARQRKADGLGPRVSERGRELTGETVGVGLWATRPRRGGREEAWPERERRSWARGGGIGPGDVFIFFKKQFYKFFLKYKIILKLF